jgi:hypothetical protein
VLFYSFDAIWGTLFLHEGVQIPANHKYQTFPPFIVKLLVNVACWNLLFKLMVQNAPNDSILPLTIACALSFQNVMLALVMSRVGLDHVHDGLFYLSAYKCTNYM